MSLLTDDESKQRLTCSRGGRSCFVFYDNPVPVVAAIVEYDGEQAPQPTNAITGRASNNSNAGGDSVTESTGDVILVRGVGWPDNFFGLVTGFLERGETPESGCLREIKEELGLTASIQSLIGVYSFRRMNQVIIAYHVRAHGVIQMDTRELAAYKRVPIGRLRPWPMGTGMAVRDFLLQRARGLTIPKPIVDSSLAHTEVPPRSRL